LAGSTELDQAPHDSHLDDNTQDTENIDDTVAGNDLCSQKHLKPATRDGLLFNFIFKIF
jgi:hypothetical protein